MKVYREKIKSSLEEQILLQTDLKISTDDSQEIINELQKGELIVAVVGEVNRGKSTFLNALMGSEVFPSRATVCTAGVTVLDNADVPKAQIVYNNGKTEELQINSENPAKVLSEHISRKNTNVRDISSLNIKYPNQFSGNGILIVDTPGVNDPDNWREEITYNYLGAADAVIMLLDPMKPLSASETEFLKDKILDHSISNLIFIGNKIDHIPMNDRKGIKDRLNNILSDYVTTPNIHFVSSKQALEGKIQKNDSLLLSSGFKNFEDYLLQFLMKGRGGALLETKINKALVILDDIDEKIFNRMGALDSEKVEVETKLKEAKSELKNIEKKKTKLQKDVQNEKKSVVLDLRKVIESRLDYFNNVLKSQIINETDLPQLRKKVLNFQKETVKIFSDSITQVNKNLIKKYRINSIEVMSGVKDLLTGLNKQAVSSTGSLEINKIKEKEKIVIDDQVADGAKIGGVAGTATGLGVAAGLPWLTSGLLGVSVGLTGLGTIMLAGLTGGLGLIAGAGVASYLKNKKQEQLQANYIEQNDMASNDQAVNSVANFLKGMSSQSQVAGGLIVKSFIENVIGPIERKILDQGKQIKNIKNDLNKTEKDQQSLRTKLNEMSKSTGGLRGQYNKIVSEIKSI